ncbi:MAG: DNA-binding protein [Pseudomonadota bacterium]|jgi:hypothetical protein
MTEPMTATRFAYVHGLSERCVVKYCREGRIVGALKHPLTKKWLIFPPAKIAPPRGSL